MHLLEDWKTTIWVCFYNMPIANHTNGTLLQTNQHTLVWNDTKCLFYVCNFVWFVSPASIYVCPLQAYMYKRVNDCLYKVSYDIIIHFWDHN